MHPDRDAVVKKDPRRSRRPRRWWSRAKVDLIYHTLGDNQIVGLISWHSTHWRAWVIWKGEMDERVW